MKWPACGATDFPFFETTESSCLSLASLCDQNRACGFTV